MYFAFTFWFSLVLIRFLHGRSNWSSLSFSSTTFQNFSSALSKSVPYKAVHEMCHSTGYCSVRVASGCSTVEVANCLNAGKANSSWDSVCHCSRALDWRSNLLLSCKPTSWRGVFLEKLVTVKHWSIYHVILTKLRGLSPHANYTDRAAAAGRRS